MCDLLGFLTEAQERKTPHLTEHYVPPDQVSWTSVLRRAKDALLTTVDLAKDALRSEGQADLAAVVNEWLLHSLRWLDWDTDSQLSLAYASWVALFRAALERHNTRRRPEQTQSLERPVLAGFNLVRDVTVELSEDNLSLVSHMLQKASYAAKLQPGLWEKVCNALSDPERHSKYTEDPVVLASIVDHLQGLLPRVSLGGAPANMAFILALLGEPVYLVSPYFSTSLPLADLPKGRVYHLQYNNKEQKFSPFQAEENGASNPDHPYFITLAITAPANLECHGCARKCKVSQPTRALLTGKVPVSASNNASRRWNQVKVVWKGRSHSLSSPHQGGSWPDRWWPRVLLFASVEVEGEALTIRPVPEDDVSRWASESRCRLALIRDPGTFGEDAAGKALTEAKRAQLSALRSAGAGLHFELGPGFDTQLFMDFQKSRSDPQQPADRTLGTVSGSLNPDELVAVHDQALSQVLRLSNKSYDNLSRPTVVLDRGPLGLLNRFLLGARIRELLGLEWLYIHGNEIDLAVFHAGSLGPDPQLGHRLRDAMLVAKAAVVGGLICRLPEDQQNAKRAEALEEPGPCKKGMLALVAFANELAAWHIRSQGTIQSLSKDREDKDKILRALLETGVWVDPTSATGIAVAPVVWPDVAREFPTTGAGDFSSAVVAALMTRSEDAAETPRQTTESNIYDA